MKSKISVVQSEITEDEKRLVRMLADGKTGKDIADEQGENYNTFAFNLGLLKSKCNVSNTTQLVAFFIRNKLID